MRNHLRSVAGVAVFLVVCELVARSGLAPQEYLPPPSVVLTELVRLLGERDFVLDVIATVLAWAIALGVAAAVAIPGGLLLGSVPVLRTAVSSLVDFLRPIPSVALIPLVLVAIGSGPESKILLAVYAAVWPLLFNTMYALREIDGQHVETARAFNLPRHHVLLRVQLPSVTPFVLTGLRLAASTALIVLISVEMLAGGAGGLGQFIFIAGSGGGRMDQVMAGTVLAGILGYLVNAGMAGAQRRWVTWAPAGAAT